MEYNFIQKNQLLNEELKKMYHILSKLNRQENYLLIF